MADERGDHPMRMAKDFGPSPEPRRPPLRNRAEALQLLRGQLGDGLVVTHTIERDWGWAFTLDTPEHAESGAPEDLCIGIGPVLVDRDGSVHPCASSMPAEGWVEEYERRLAWRRRRARLKRWLGRLWPGHG